MLLHDLKIAFLVRPHRAGIFVTGLLAQLITSEIVMDARREEVKKERAARLAAREKAGTAPTQPSFFTNEKQ